MDADALFDRMTDPSLDLRRSVKDLRALGAAPSLAILDELARAAAAVDRAHYDMAIAADKILAARDEAAAHCKSAKGDAAARYAATKASGAAVLAKRLYLGERESTRDRRVRGLVVKALGRAGR